MTKRSLALETRMWQLSDKFIRPPFPRTDTPGRITRDRPMRGPRCRRRLDLIPHMLPDFPKIRKELEARTMLKLFEMARQIEPVLGEIRGVTQHEGDVIAYDQLTQHGVKVVTEDFKESRIQFETKVEDVPTLVGEKLDIKLWGIAEQMAAQLAGSLRQTLDTTTREVGNAVDAQGAPISKELWLQTMQRLEMTFDSAGRPQHIFWAGPKMIEFMRKAWEDWTQDREFMRKYKELLAQKYEEWRDRESCRKLVD